MDYRADELVAFSNRLFNRDGLLSLWQEIADNFYVERADFTISRSLGDEYADHLTSSYPVLARRDLGNLLGAMLRPRDKAWFKMSVEGAESDVNAQRYLEYATKLQRNAMYDVQSGFVRATKEGDHDYATFGQCVISTEMDWSKVRLLYRCHHLRDVAWCEDYAGQVDRVDVKMKMPVRDIYRKFGEDKLHPDMVNLYREDMYKECEVRHIVLPSENYESNFKDSRTGKAKRYKQPFVSIYIDVANRHIIEEVGSWTRVYTIPRWQTVSGSQYSHSPATVAALPDARLYQAISLTLLEAGENYTRPPMIAVKEAIRGDVNLFSGGITWVDEQYDERLGEVLRPISQDRGGFNAGVEIQQMVKETLHKAFFLDRINLPNRGSAEMTAYETAQRVQEYIRDALPIFEPMEYDYNGNLCEMTFETLMRNGAFGPPDIMPESLSGREIKFKFESPLHAAEDRLKGQQFMGALGLIGQALGIDPTAANVMKIKDGLKDAVMGSGVPAAWINSEEEIMQLDQAAAEQQQAQQLMAGLQQGAEIAKTAGEAGEAISGAMATGE